MSKGLEAFNEVIDTICCQRPNPNLQNATDIVVKELKALEIIKSKNVDIAILKNTENVEQYNNTVLLFFKCSKELTQEEYDLLKEVLL